MNRFHNHNYVPASADRLPPKPLCDVCEDRFGNPKLYGINICDDCFVVQPDSINVLLPPGVAVVG